MPSGFTFGWPAGKPEKLPVVQENGKTNVPGLWVAGDLSGIPLLKFSLETGAQSIRTMHKEGLDAVDGGHQVVIIGAGVAGHSAAAEAAKLGLDYLLIESNQSYATIANFPKGKPIYTYPQEMEPNSNLQVTGQVKEDLLRELQEQSQALGIEPQIMAATHVERRGKEMFVHRSDGEPIKARSVLVAIGRSGNFRRMNIPGEDSDKVANRLHDPAAYVGRHTAVIGGGDSACEAAIAIAEANLAYDSIYNDYTDHGSDDGDSRPMVSLIYRGETLSRPKPENVEKLMALAQAQAIDVQLSTSPTAITDHELELKTKKAAASHSIPNDAVLSLIGREPPLDFFRKSGVNIRGEMRISGWFWLTVFMLFCTVMYGMKVGIWPMNKLNYTAFDPVTWFSAIKESAGYNEEAPTLWQTWCAVQRAMFHFG